MALQNNNIQNKIVLEIDQKTTFQSISADKISEILKDQANFTQEKTPFDMCALRINNTAVEAVLIDNIGYTTGGNPTVTNPQNGIILLEKTNFFSGIPNEKLEFEHQSTYDNGGTLFHVTSRKRNLYPNSQLELTFTPLSGVITGSPSISNFLIKIKKWQ